MCPSLYEVGSTNTNTMSCQFLSQRFTDLKGEGGGGATDSLINTCAMFILDAT